MTAKQKFKKDYIIVILITLLFPFLQINGSKISRRDVLATKSFFTTKDQVIYLKDAEQTLKEMFKQKEVRTLSEVKSILDEMELPYFWSNIEGEIIAKLNHGCKARFYGPSASDEDFKDRDIVVYIELEIEDKAQPGKIDPSLGMGVEEAELKKWKEMSQMKDDGEALKARGYELLEEYAQGVYLGWDLKNEREVFINVSPRYLKPLRSKEELEALKEVPEHHNIATLYEVGSFRYNGIGQDVSYMIWEFREGISLEEEEHSAEKGYKRYNRTLAQALKMANQLFEVVILYGKTPLKRHGDFHSRNILVDKQGDVFVTDPIHKHPFWADTQGTDLGNLAKILNFLLCSLAPKNYEGVVTELLDEESFNKLRKFIDQTEVSRADADKEALYAEFKSIVAMINKKYLDFSFYQLIQLYGSEREQMWLPLGNENPIVDKGKLSYFRFDPASLATTPVWGFKIKMRSLLLEHSC